jgi:DNA-binding NarL/FixJ family response regulator
VRRISFAKPDVAIVDIRLPPTHTDEGCRRPSDSQRCRSVEGAGAARYVEPAYARALLRSGRRRRLSPEGRVSVAEFTDAVRRVAAGARRWIGGRVAVVGRRRVDDPLAELTARERRCSS